MKRLTQPLALLVAVACVVMMAASLPVGCSDDDPVVDTCNSVCGLAQEHPCKEQETACLATCHQLGNDAKARGYRPDQCATCLLGLIEYTGYQCKASDSERCLFGGSLNTCEPFPDCKAGGGNKCFGVNTTISFTDPKCIQFCVEPDAGVAYRGL